MGFMIEQNWYIVVKDELPQPNVDESRDYVKDGYREFPVSDNDYEYELPIILRGQCIGMGIVTMQIHAGGKTHIKYKLVKRFEKNDPVAIHYTDMYRTAKGITVEEER